MLAFFPAAFSSVCAKEMRTFHDHEKLSFPLLSDFNKQVIREYGVFHEDMIGWKICLRGPSPGGRSRGRFQYRCHP